MSYIGNQPTVGQYRKLDDISGSFNGSLTAFTMQVGSTNVSAGSVFQLLISLGGVIQEPGTDFTVSGSTITFTTAPAASLSFFGIMMGQPLNTATPGDSTVTGAKIVDGTITGGKLAAAFNYDSGLLFLDDTNNRVGIGTASPTRPLTVAAESGASVNILGVFDARSADSGTVGNCVIAFSDPTSTAGQFSTRLGSVGDSLAFYTNGSNERMRILAGGGITFNGDTAAANALDDYEEGTWVPTIDIGGATTGITYAQQKGIYTKIGDVLVVGCWIELSSKGTATGAVRIDGLPFAANIPGGPVNAGVLVNETWTSSWPQTTTYGLTWSDGYVYLRYNNTTSWAAIGDSNLLNNTQIYWSNTFKIS